MLQVTLGAGVYSGPGIFIGAGVFTGAGWGPYTILSNLLSLSFLGTTAFLGLTFGPITLVGMGVFCGGGIVIGIKSSTFSGWSFPLKARSSEVLDTSDDRDAE